MARIAAFKKRICEFIIISMSTVRKCVMRIESFCEHENCLLMPCGLVLILVVSRIVALKGLWLHWLGPSYRVVKNAFEKGNELLGYIFCLVATLKYAIGLIRSNN